MSDGLINRYTGPTADATTQMLNELAGTAKNSLSKSPFDTATEGLMSVAAWPIRAIGNTTARAVYDMLNLTRKAAWETAKLPFKLAANTPIIPIPRGGR